MSAAASQLKKSHVNVIRHKLAEDHMSISTFAKKTGTERHFVRQLPLSQLEKISRKLAAAQDPKEAERLKKRFMEGYYGKPLHLLHAEDTTI